MEKRYTVKETVELTGVKSHVLRYWEEELGLTIHRNELGHRYYTGNDIQLFQNINDLKSKGMQLRVIRDKLPDFNERQEKQEIHPKSDKILEFQMILERLILQEMKSKSKEETHFRKLDAAIRKQQQMRKEVAAALESGKNK